MNATDLQIGEKARITGYTTKDFELKLIEFGFVKGARISPSYKAPLGCPTAFQIEDGLVSLRREEASQILVEKEAK